MFFGREDDFRFVQNRVDNGGYNRVIVFSGDRRSGKTSVLFQILEARLGPKYAPVLIDLQMYADVTNNLEFFEKIGQTIASALGLEGSREPASVNYNSISDVLGQFQRNFPDRALLLLFDEYEIIESKIEDGSLAASVIQILAGTIESTYRVSMIMTGSSDIGNRSDCWQPLLPKSIHRKISFLSKADTRRLIAEPLREIVDFQDSVVERIFRESAGQPFYTQVICQNLVDILLESDRIDPTISDVEEVVSYVSDNPVPHMIYTWRANTDDVRLVLSALATLIRRTDEWVSPRRVRNLLARRGRLAGTTLDKSHELLENAFRLDLLEKDSDRYRFRMDILRHWIAREHSIWSVALVDQDRTRRAVLLKWIPPAALLLIVVTTAAVLLLARRGIPTLTVEPIEVTGEMDEAWIADGFARAIAANLTTIRNVNPLPYASIRSRTRARFSLSLDIEAQGSRF